MIRSAETGPRLAIEVAHGLRGGFTLHGRHFRLCLVRTYAWLEFLGKVVVDVFVGERVGKSCRIIVFGVTVGYERDAFLVTSLKVLGFGTLHLAIHGLCDTLQLYRMLWLRNWRLWFLALGSRGQMWLLVHLRIPLDLLYDLNRLRRRDLRAPVLLTCGHGGHVLERRRWIELRHRTGAVRAKSR